MRSGISKNGSACACWRAGRGMSRPPKPGSACASAAPYRRHRERAGSAWRVTRQTGRELTVGVAGQFARNSSLPGRLGAEGEGLAFLPHDIVAPHLACGRLVEALADWCPTFQGYHLRCPHRRPAHSQLRPSAFAFGTKGVSRSSPQRRSLLIGCSWPEADWPDAVDAGSQADRLPRTSPAPEIDGRDGAALVAELCFPPARS